MQAKRLILFDIDGTLLITPGAGRRSMDRTFEELFGVKNPFDGYNFMGKTDPGIWRDAARKWLGRDPSGEEVSAANQRYLEIFDDELARCREDIRLMPGIPRALEWLQEAGIPLGLATGNLEQGARMKLEAVGLWSFFRFGGYGSDAEHRGELTRRGIEKGRALFGAVPDHQVYVVGDTPLDIEAARYCGVPCIAVPTGWHKEADLLAANPHVVLPDLTDRDRLWNALGL